MPAEPQAPGRRAAGKLARTWDGLFTSRPGPDQVWVWLVVLAALYLGGLAAWGVFFHWGDFPYKFHDWAEVNMARLAFMRDAVMKGQLPLHMPDASALRGITDRYLVLPDVITAPQMIFMGLMSVTQFVFLDVLFLYTLGTAGLLWFKRKYALSPASFTLLFLAFQFNGHIQAHLSVGHVTWLGYFLFPWLVALAIRLIEAPAGWRWTAGTAFLLFFMLLQGSFHQFIWSLMFLGLVGLAAWRRFWAVLRALLFAGLLSAVRLLPPALGMGSFNTDFLSGYPRPGDVLTALLRIVPPAEAYATRLQHHSLGWWELDLYLGLAGTLLVAVFGVGMWLWNQRREKQYWQLLPAVVILALFSMWQVYKPVMSLPIPFLTAERVSSRMIILPFAVTAILAAVNLQRWLDGPRAGFLLRLGLVALLAVFGWNLWQHLEVWQVARAASGFPFADVNLAIKVVSNHPDPVYPRVAAAGAGLSALSGVFLLWMAYREQRRMIYIEDHHAPRPSV
ncbi:MAG TPA: hypothetical protein VF813_09240 [Anaerolineaceae bacterium]